MRKKGTAAIVAILPVMPSSLRGGFLLHMPAQAAGGNNTEVFSRNCCRMKTRTEAKVGMGRQWGAGTSPG